MAFCSALTHPVIELAKMCHEDSVLENLESEMKEGPPSWMACLFNFLCGCLESWLPNWLQNWLHKWQAEEIVEEPAALLCFRCRVPEPGFFCRECRYVRYCGEVCKIIFKIFFWNHLKCNVKVCHEADWNWHKTWCLEEVSHGIFLEVTMFIIAQLIQSRAVFLSHFLLWIFYET